MAWLIPSNDKFPYRIWHINKATTLIDKNFPIFKGYLFNSSIVSFKYDTLALMCFTQKMRINQLFAKSTKNPEAIFRWIRYNRKIPI